MNVAGLSGRLVDDIRINHTSAGKEVANGTIAVQRSFKNSEGKYDADFIDFTCWGGGAPVMAEYVKKGDKFSITGELRTRIREKDGVKFKVTEVNVRDFDLPDKPKQQKSFESEGEPYNDPNNQLPF